MPGGVGSDQVLISFGSARSRMRRHNAHSGEAHSDCSGSLLQAKLRSAYGIPALGLGLADPWLCSKPNPTQNPGDGRQSAHRHQPLNGYGDRLISGLLHHQGHDLDSIQFFDKLTHEYSPDGRWYVMV